MLHTTSLTWVECWFTRQLNCYLKQGFCFWTPEGATLDCAVLRPQDIYLPAIAEGESKDWLD